MVVTTEQVNSTIDSFSRLDASGDRRAMNKLAKRLGREQPALLQFAAAVRDDHSEEVGEAAVFYGTLVWSMFDRANNGRALPRLTSENLEEADKLVAEALATVADVEQKPVHERVATDISERQPHIYAKLAELIEEDVREEAMTAACAAAIFRPTQSIVEAFDAALEGRRPGERQGPIVREAAKVGRNEPCSCGSGKKFKKCCGQAAG